LVKRKEGEGKVQVGKTLKKEGWLKLNLKRDITNLIFSTWGKNFKGLTYWLLSPKG